MSDEKDYFDAGKIASDLKNLIDVLYGYMTDRNMHGIRLVTLEVGNKSLELYIKAGEIIQKDRIRPPADPQLPLDHPDYR